MLIVSVIVRLAVFYLSTRVASAFTLNGVSLVDSVANNWDCTLPTSMSKIDASGTGRVYVLLSWSGYTSGSLRIQTSSTNTSQLLSPTDISFPSSSGIFSL